MYFFEETKESINENIMVDTSTPYYNGNSLSYIYGNDHINDLIQDRLPKIDVECLDNQDVAKFFTGDLIENESENYKNVNEPIIQTTTLKSDVENKKNLPRFKLSKQWNGAVLEIKEDTFIARLVNTKDTLDQEETELYIEDVNPDDKSLLKVGALFYLSMGQILLGHGQLFNTINVRFKRLPKISEKDIKNATEKSEKWAAAFNM